MSASDDDVEDMPEEKTKVMAEGQKAKGNAAFGKGETTWSFSSCSVTDAFWCQVTTKLP